MYENQSYDEYIRNVLGYPSQYETNNNFNYEKIGYNTNRDIELENMYPEIYKIVYPMVRKVCTSTNAIPTNENINSMVDEIYLNIESDNIFNVNINLQNELEGNRSNGIEKEQKIKNKNTVINNKIKETVNTKIEENREEVSNRQFSNRNLRDLIKILIIRELLQNQRPGPSYPGRPPFPPPPPMPPNRPPMRPPFPPGNRPPIRPRINTEYDLYE